MRNSIAGMLAVLPLSLTAGPTAAAHSNLDPRISGILTGTFQAASRSHAGGQAVNSEGNGELYLIGSLAMGPGRWNLELRGSTTPRNHGVSGTYGSNASVGETTGPGGHGRIAATQLYYQLPTGPGTLQAGLLDATAVLDGNDVMNTEYEQFLADAFVKNPTIGFPSFALGADYQAPLNAHYDYTLFVSSSSGLQDPDDPTYRNVFDVDAQGKGAFTAAELGWHAGRYAARAGIWYDSADRARLDRPPGHNGYGYGAYVLAGGPAGPGRWQFRAGVANGRVQPDANFVSVGYSLPIRDTTLAAAVARRGYSAHLPFDAAPIYQAEVYWRVHVAGPVHISPDLQYIDNADFHAHRDGVVVGGVRIGVTL